ncbi:glucan 1, partial [Quercus suber]
NPTPKYVEGSLQALDNAFLWAKKYGVKIIIDLHAAPGSQNGWEHGSSRDGSQEWGKTDENIQQTVDIIEFLTARYAKNPSLYAVELINEPRAPGASQESLNKYYKAGYEAVRKHSNAYVVLSNRLGPADPREFLSLASEWVAEWNVKGATKEEYQKFAEAQLDVYGRATFGWAYWTLKNVNNPWSLEWMIKNGYIKL